MDSPRWYSVHKRASTRHNVRYGRDHAATQLTPDAYGYSKRHHIDRNEKQKMLPDE